MKKRTKISILISTISAIVVLFILTNYSDLLFSYAEGKKVKIGATKKENTVPQDLQKFNDAFVNVSNQVTPSVVSIIVTTNAKKTNPHQFDEFFRFFPENPQVPKPKEEDFQTQGGGSGVIVTSDGYIITNNHVVENATENGIEIIFKESKRVKAKLIGRDPLTDVAVIKIELDNLQPAFLANSDEVKVGQWVLAIGSPLGLNSTVTAGIVSYLGRRIDIIQDNYGVENFIQTDAAINPGNSGGALVNLNGEVIGINTAIASSNYRYQGYGFAIPINLVKSVAEDLIEHGKVTRGYIGVQIQSVDETIAKANGLLNPEGVFVQSVLEEGAAKSAGILEGDIILTIDGKPLKSSNDLQAYVAGKHPGDVVKLEVWRNKSKINISVSLKERANEQTNLASNNTSLNENESPVTKVADFSKLGFIVEKASSTIMNQRKVQSEVLVKEVRKFSEAENRGLRVGDIIVEIDRKAILKIDEVESILKQKKSGDAVMFRIKDSKGTSRFIALEFVKE
ncbi:MAG: Do family serine endopeptidase [Bacteroidetes bacterium]|nr:Do family serine endopeptidase [Bacteroidota bacterium]